MLDRPDAPGVTVDITPSRPAERRAAHHRTQRLVRRALAVAVPIALLAIWEIAARVGLLDMRIFPAPTTIVGQGIDLGRDGRLLDDVWKTLSRVLVGYPLGALAGFVLGIVMGLSAYVRSALESTLNGLYVVPKLALLPVFLSIVGFGEPPLVALIATTVFFFVWIGTMEAVAAIPEGYREAARSLGLSRRRTFGEVVVPAILPEVFVALRVGMGVAVLVIVAAEFIATDTGLGFLIFNSRALLINGWMYVGILTVAVLGVLLTILVGAVGRRLTPWVRSSTGSITR
ncbi:ABC transporter permease [Pseudonocardia sp. NPDC049154]|uniref:ABC transporter permease n=1 Tax=Pseudonocardia sp. NPDC049154 TaxID=3155501 RepID=UPI0033C95686